MDDLSLIGLLLLLAALLGAAILHVVDDRRAARDFAQQMRSGYGRSWSKRRQR